MLGLFPEIKPYQRHFLVVGDGHTLYVDESGSPQGLPVIFIHGGPGGGCDSSSRRYFDPSIYRIITFDQRGCGRSTPHASLENNTTQHLIEDMEVIRNHIGIDQWVLFGGSWGSTLALAYAQTYPERVLAMILRGVFLCRPQDLLWFYQSGAGRLFPDYWQDFIECIPIEEHQNLMAAYHRRLTGSDQIAQMHCAKAWSLWEARTATLRPNPGLVERFTDGHRALAMARIECHYFMNGIFLKENQLIENMPKIAQIPSILVHGRYDVVCPLDNAWAIHQCWPKSQLHIVRDAGHAAGELGILDALVKATQEMATLLLDEGAVDD